MIIKSSILILLCFVISIIDAKKFIIPDILVCGIFLFSMGMDFAFDKANILSRICFSVLIFLIFFFIYKIKKGLGFGDVKYISALSYGFGFFPCVTGCILASVLGILYFGIKKLKGVYITKIPYAPFLSAGVIVSYFSGRCLNGF